MNILVTGGSGRIGRYVVRELTQAGHEMTSVDVLPFPAAPCRHLRADLTRAGEVYQVLAAAKADAVVHLGAWANVGIVPDNRTYVDNVAGTFHVFQACRDLGIKRVVWASSVQVYGLPYAPPLYVPIDEDHPLRPQNCYALSKMAGEQAAEYFVDRWAMTILSFRFTGVMAPADLNRYIDRMQSDPSRGADVLWTPMDARDAALACRLAVEAPQVSSGPYNIASSQVALPESIPTLVNRYFGDQTKIRAPLADQLSGYSSARAESAFGFRARYLWSVSKRYPETLDDDPPLSGSPGRGA